MLSALICFRTPRVLKELVNLSKCHEICYPKAELRVEKTSPSSFGLMSLQLGLRKGLSSYFHPVRWSDLDSFPKSEKWMDLARTRARFAGACCNSLVLAVL